MPVSVVRIRPSAPKFQFRTQKWLQMGPFLSFCRPIADKIHNCRPQSTAFHSTIRVSSGINKRDRIVGIKASHKFCPLSKMVLSPIRYRPDSADSVAEQHN